MNRKGKRNLPQWENKTATYQEYPIVVWEGYVDRTNFYDSCRAVEVAENVFRFEKHNGEDAMGNVIWKPLADENYKGLA